MGAAVGISLQGARVPFMPSGVDELDWSLRQWFAALSEGRPCALLLVCGSDSDVTRVRVAGGDAVASAFDALGAA